MLDFRHGAPAAGRWNGSGSANRPAPPGYRLYVLRPEAMIINALFFASYRDIAGTDELRVELPGDSRVDDLVHLLRASGDGWEALPAAPAVAVNQDYAPLSTPLRDGDEVAFIPPVAGG